MAVEIVQRRPEARIVDIFEPGFMDNGQLRASRSRELDTDDSLTRVQINASPE
ncbi:hypothetical protein K523DRAFT_319376, partial [Schizophyllum commune Tattone D]